MKALFQQWLLALSFLTRLPLPSRWFAAGEDAPKLSAAAWAFPIIGALIGLVSGAVAYGGLVLFQAPLVAALLAVTAAVLMTGGLHEDGLADFCDGLGVTGAARALEVMRDSRSGSFGVIGLFFALSLRVAALAAVLALPAVTLLDLLVYCLLVGALARAAMALLLLLPPARPDGLAVMARSSTAFGPVVAAMLIAIGGAVLLAGWAAGLLALVAAVLAVGLTGLVAQRRLGGMTGDVYGAAEQLAEIAIGLALLCFFSLA